MNATKIDQRPKCCECGSYNVETTAWVDYRPDGTIAIVPGEGPHDDESGNWCHDCREHVHLDYPDFTPEDRAAVAAADRAREHGPELLAALRTAVEIMRDNYIDEELSGQFEVFTDAIAKASGRDET